MKKVIIQLTFKLGFVLLIVYSFSVGMIFTSCTEEIVKVDTVKIIQYREKEKILYSVDTVYTIIEIPITVTKDSIVYVPKEVYIIDSVFIEDTKYIHHYQDTLYFMYFDRPGSRIDPELRPIVREFYEETIRRGFIGLGEEQLTIDYWFERYTPLSPGWTSFTLPHSLEPLYIMVTGDISYDEMYTPIIREIALRQLELPYSDDPDDIMHPLFDVKKLKYSSPLSLKKVYFDKMFSRVNEVLRVGGE